jgi:hypothetical protein
LLTGEAIISPNAWASLAKPCSGASVKASMQRGLGRRVEAGLALAQGLLGGAYRQRAQRRLAERAGHARKAARLALEAGAQELRHLLARDRHQLLLGREPVDEALLECGGRTQQLAVEDQVERCWQADQPREVLRAAKARHDAELGLGQPDLRGRVLAEHAHVAEQRQLAAAADAGAFDGRHDRDCERLAAREDRAAQRRGLGPFLDRLDRVDQRDVGAGAEHAFAGAGQDQALERRRLLQFLQAAVERQQAFFGERDHGLVGCAEAQHGDAGLVDVQRQLQGLLGLGFGPGCGGAHGARRLRGSWPGPGRRRCRGRRGQSACSAGAARAPA